MFIQHGRATTKLSLRLKKKEEEEEEEEEEE